MELRSLLCNTNNNFDNDDDNVHILAAHLHGFSHRKESLCPTALCGLYQALELASWLAGRKWHPTDLTLDSTVKSFGFLSHFALHMPACPGADPCICTKVNPKIPIEVVIPLVCVDDAILATIQLGLQASKADTLWTLAGWFNCTPS
eukprot:jgi/Bigna1/72908/fgenesh1_pg.22_\